MHDPFEQYENKPAYFLKGESERRSMQSIDQRMRNMRSGGKRRQILKLLGAAAVIFVVFLSGKYFLLGDPDDVELATNFSEPFPNYRSVSLRGESSETDLALAFAAYNNADYQRAVELFGTPDDPVDKLYLAIAMQQTAEWRGALEVLESISGQISEDYQPAADWYYALSLIALERKSEAQPLLDSLMNGNSTFATRAAQLSRSLD